MRVEVHNLRHGETQEREGKSENHLTFALLLGDGQSVRFDMTPDAITHIGSMVVQDRDEYSSLSYRTIADHFITAPWCRLTRLLQEQAAQTDAEELRCSSDRFLLAG
jgi:hypothetical protein